MNDQMYVWFELRKHADRSEAMNTLSIHFRSSPAYRDVLEQDLDGMEVEIVERSGIDGTILDGDTLSYVVTVGASSPVLVKLLDLLDRSLQRRHERREISNVTVARDEERVAAGVAPSNAADLLRRMQDGG